jgi:polar amino acid transport system substrate-binding protein
MQSNRSKIIGLVILVVIVSLFTTTIATSSTHSSNSTASVYNRVFKSGIIRACYVVYPPDLIKDPNTGKLSGISYDALNKAASNMGLKVDWNLEVDWGSMIQSLNSDRCDIIGQPSWTNSSRAKSAEFSVPLFYSAINAYTRADDYRFDNNPLSANNPAYKIAVIDGETAQVIAQTQFPEAKTVAIPQTADVSEMLLNVATHKADITFVEATIANQFLKTNPGSLKNVSNRKPIVVYGNVLMVKKGEYQLLTSINGALDELLNNGYIDQLINQYGKAYPGGFYKVASPYTIPAAN